MIYTQCGILRNTPAPQEILVTFMTNGVPPSLHNVLLRASDVAGDGSDAAIEAAARAKLPQPASPDTPEVSQQAELVDAKAVAVAAVALEEAPVDAAVRDLNAGNAANQAQRDDEAAQYNAILQQQ